MRITWRCERVGAGGLDEEKGELGWQRVVRLLQSGGYGWSEGGVATWNSETTTTPPGVFGADKVCRESEGSITFVSYFFGGESEALVAWLKRMGVSLTC